MKKLIIIATVALMPFATFAADGKKTKSVDIHITTDKNGNVEITGLDNTELKKLEKELNKALKNVNIKIDDGKEKHQVHFKAELKID